MLELNFTPFPELESPRLHLKRINPTCVKDVFEIRSNENTMRFIPRPVAKTHDDALAVINMINEAIDKNDGINWGLFLKESGKLIGIAGFVRINKNNHRGEVGYVLNSSYHKKGFMNEALDSILEFGFSTLNFNCIEAIIDPENNASISVVENLKFTREGRLRDYTFHNEKYSDAFVYSKLKSEAGHL